MGVIGSRKSKKDRQYNRQKKKDRQYNRQKKKDRQYNGQKKKDRQYNGQKMKDRQYNDQKKKDRQYNGQKKKDRQYNGQKEKGQKDKQYSTIRYVYRKSNVNTTKNRGWTQVLQKGTQFLLQVHFDNHARSDILHESNFRIWHSRDL